MAKEKCRPILTGKTICATPELFNEGNLGKGPFQGGFQPTDISGLILWLDDPNVPSNIIEDGGNNVSQWTDISGNSNHFVQSTGADQPLRSGSDITFDGVSEFLQSDANIANFSSDTQGTLVFIGAPAAINDRPFSLVNDVNRRMFFFLRNPSGRIESNLRDNTNPDTDAESTNSVSGNDQRLAVFRSTGTVYKIDLQGVSETVIITSGIDDGSWFSKAAGLTELRIGRLQSILFNITMNTYLYYNVGISDDNLVLLTAYLDDRFTLGL